MQAPAQLVLRVSPNARLSAFAGWTADEKGRPVLLVKLEAPAAEGKANVELIRFLAVELGVPTASITLLSGAGGRQKRVELPCEALDRLPRPS